MKLLQFRHTYDPECTLGSLYAGDALHCFTLEDANRLALGFDKIKKKTAIPVGVYQVVMSYSPKFQRTMPLILDVKGFTYVRYHIGNDDEDTEGCPLVGTTLRKGRLIGSRIAFEALRTLIAAEERTNGVLLEVVDGLFPAQVKTRCEGVWLGDGRRTPAGGV